MNLFHIISINSTKYGSVSKTLCVCKPIRHKENPIQLALNSYLKSSLHEMNILCVFHLNTQRSRKLKGIYSIHRTPFVKILSLEKCPLQSTVPRTYNEGMQNVSTEYLNYLKKKKNEIKQHIERYQQSTPAVPKTKLMIIVERSS